MARLPGGHGDPLTSPRMFCHVPVSGKFPTGHAAIRPEAAHVATEAVASAWQSRALVCAEVCRIGERMKPAPTSTQAEREQIYSAEYDEQGALRHPPMDRGNAGDD